MPSTNAAGDQHQEQAQNKCPPLGSIAPRPRGKLFEPIRQNSNPQYLSRRAVGQTAFNAQILKEHMLRRPCRGVVIRTGFKP